MKKNILVLILVVVISSCKNDKSLSGNKIEIVASSVQESTVQIHKDKNTIKERFSAPKGYTWVKEQPNSFGYFLENFKLKPYGSQILKYDGTPIATQNLHEAVL